MTSLFNYAGDTEDLELLHPALHYLYKNMYQRNKTINIYLSSLDFDGLSDCPDSPECTKIEQYLTDHYWSSNYSPINYTGHQVLRMVLPRQYGALMKFQQRMGQIEILRDALLQLEKLKPDQKTLFEFDSRRI